MTVYDLSIDDEGTLFCASNSQAVNGSNGILRSINQGMSWELVCDFGNDAAVSICNNENENSEIYALKSSGDENLYKSIDKGTTWSLLSVPTSPDWLNLEIISCGDVLFVTQYHGSGSRLLRSANEGQSWDSLFSVSGTSEIISAIDISSSDEMFLSVYGHFQDQGGLYRSTDNGTSWELFSLGGNYITDVKFNSIGDLFITSCGLESEPGLYVVYSGEEVVTPILQGPLFLSLGINDSDDIFAGTANCRCMYHSTDYGITYEWIEQNSIIYPTDILKLDSEQFIYLSSVGGKKILKSKLSTITSVQEIFKPSLLLYPNPATTFVSGFIQEQNGNFDYELIDQVGRTVRKGSIEISQGKFEVGVSGLNTGHYLLRLHTCQEVESIFIKQ